MRQWAAAVVPPPKLTTAEWAERHRKLPLGSSPVPGRWRNSTAPYLVWPMNAADVPGIAQLNFCKAAQIGVSEAIRNLIGARAQQDPEPIGLALPNKDKGEEIMANRIHPLFTQTDTLRAFHSGAKRDLKLGTVRLPNGFILHLMWAGSPASMASDPMRLAILDEVDKMAEWSGREADPVSLTAKRLRAFGDRACQINISTPTSRTGKIWILFDASPVRLYYHVPCPHCSKYIRLLFPNLHWKKQDEQLLPHERAAAVASAPEATYYTCQECSASIHEHHRWAMIQAGRWQPIDADPPIIDAHGDRHDCAETVTVWPRRSRIGLQISALYCLWTKWADIVAEHIEATTLPQRFDFKVQTLGMPFDRQVARTSTNIYATKTSKSTLPEGQAPVWTRKLIATVDTQKDHFYAVLRAWGANLRSARVWHERVESFRELDEFLLARTWPVQDQLPRPVDLILIDSGGTIHKEEAVSRTLQVYTWANQRRSRVRPLKGVAKARSEQFMWWGKGYLDLQAKHKKRRRPYLRLLRVVTNYWADLLADMVTAGTVIAPDRTEQWFLDQRDDPEYNRHMASVAKIAVRRGAQMHEEWHPLTDGARIDYWDCETYQVAAAYLLHLHNLIEVPLEGDSDDLDQELPPAPAGEPAPVRRVGNLLDG